MGKRKNHAKRSLASLPKGLPVRSSKGATDTNPFETVGSHGRGKKFVVHNRTAAKPKKTSALAEALQRRKESIQQNFQAAKKANVFLDKRIGEYNRHMTAEQQNLARLVRERSRRSKRNTKFSLDDDDGDDNGDADNDVLTHRGQSIDPNKPVVMLSDDEDEQDGNLDAADTSMHFGGGGGGRSGNNDPDAKYGSGQASMSQMYAARKMDLDDWIAHRKEQKAAKLQAKESQADTFTKMDETFAELRTVLQFRDKEQEIRKHYQDLREGKLSEEDKDMADWDKEMKSFLHADRKVKATDRTKTPEEIAKEAADRLHELETRRLARMNGDFENDDFSDVSDDDDDDDDNKKRRKRVKRKHKSNAETLSDEEDAGEDDENKTTVRFTADGLVHVDKDGVVVGKVGEEQAAEAKPSQAGFQLASELTSPLGLGTAVEASYRALEQYDGNESWFSATIAKVHNDGGKYTYDVDYDDGDFEAGVQPCHIRVKPKSEEEVEKEREKSETEAVLKRKRQKAKEKARSEIPYVFEVPTTLEALHEIIGNYAKTGADASLIVKRIYKANSVRLDKRNLEKMQNFYDVLLRRFIAVGDAIHESGDGGSELGRYKQLDSLTETLYEIAQEAANLAAAVWSRRLGFFESAHAKRLRDAEFVHDEETEEFSAWPSTGTLLALRAIGHIFPTTDLRHQIVTPTLLLLGQMIGYTPVLSIHDAVMGILCVGILLEYTKDAKRIVPEAHGFLAGIIRLFASSEKDRRGSHPLPSLEAAAELDDFVSIRKLASEFKGEEPPKIALEKASMQNSECTSAALLFSALHLAETSAQTLAGSVSATEKEVLAEILSSVLALNPKSKTDPLPKLLQSKVAAVAAVFSSVCHLDEARTPIQRRLGPSTREQAIKSLAPRLEDPDKYSMSKDKGKNATQAAADRTRREYKREHKAVARELRMDAAMIEEERRKEQHKKDSAAKAKRQKAFAWMEAEQATVNQQVRQGGGLLQGGGMGAARAKASSAKLGIKKGGKF